MSDEDALGNSSKPATRTMPDFGGGFKSISRAAISSMAVMSAGVTGWTGSAAREGPRQPKANSRPRAIRRSQAVERELTERTEERRGIGIRRSFSDAVERVCTMERAASVFTVF